MEDDRTTRFPNNPRRREALSIDTKRPSPAKFPLVLLSVDLFIELFDLLVITPLYITIIVPILWFPVKVVMFLWVFLWARKKTGMSMKLMTTYTISFLVEISPFSFLPTIFLYILYIHHLHKKDVKDKNKVIDDVEREMSRTT